ncbi:MULTISPECIES: EF-hand domain-containing protein [unclassified Sphingomonas]|jgi:hypothetical protein|uniref:EF-hand domain-containing protein n=1 Tax=unclassified Sphingomonas TaxID=196159 RepID=UPI000B17C0C1|nr:MULTISPECIES: EF-hand domain-containing protein [unclassified Sphingomonas]
MLRQMWIAVVALVPLAGVEAQQRRVPDVPAIADPRALGDRPAMATVVVEPVGMLIATFDRDGDAVVTPDELDTGVGATFTASARGAGDIGYIQFADWAERWLGDRTALPGPFEVDRDQDNRITLAELQGRMREIYARIDADKDQRVTRKELLTIRSAAGPLFDPGERRRRRR